MSCREWFMPELWQVFASVLMVRSFCVKPLLVPQQLLKLAVGRLAEKICIAAA